jgi:hypothetical protein
MLLVQEIKIKISGEDPTLEEATAKARQIAAEENQETDLISWFNRRTNKHSPSCVHCEIGCRPGWEVYGENHGGRLRIEVNNGEYVFIFS